MSDHIGGIYAVLLIPKSNLISVPDAADGMLLGDVGYFDSDENFFVQCWENGELAIAQAREKGHEFNSEIKILVPYITSGTINFLEKFDSEQVFVLVTDNNATTVAFGAYGPLATASTKYSPGKAFGDLNAHEITIVHRDRFRPPTTAQELRTIPSYTLSTSGILRPIGASATLAIGPQTLVHARVQLTWLELGHWRFGNVVVLFDTAYHTALDENAEENVAASTIAPTAALVDNAVVLSFATENIEIIYYKIVDYVA